VSAGEDVRFIDSVKRVGGEYTPVFLVAVAVVIVGTVVGSVLDHVHQVTADEQNVPEVMALAGPDSTQTVTLANWKVHFSSPLASEMPLIHVAQVSPDSVGLSSADLAKLGGQCSARSNGLGALLRYKVGSFGASVPATPGSNLVSTVGDYEYVYQFPQNSCSDSAQGMAIINREEAVLLEALSSLASLN
jgi:hypothetical protein